MPIEVATTTHHRRQATKLFVTSLYDTQKVRIEIGNRIARLVRDGVMEQEEADAFFKIPFDHFEAAEKSMASQVWRLVRDERIVKEWLGRVRGIGPRLSGLLVAIIGTPERFENTAKLWAYAGLHTKEGLSVRRERGVKSNWNDDLKITAWKIAQSFVKCGGPYKVLYENYKARIVQRELARGNIIWATVDDKVRPHLLPDGVEKPAKAPEKPEWTLGRIHNMALRYIAKMFLSHLLTVWRTIEGLPVREPYAIEYLGHTTFLDPWTFVESAEVMEES